MQKLVACHRVASSSLKRALLTAALVALTAAFTLSKSSGRPVEGTSNELGCSGAAPCRQAEPRPISAEEELAQKYAPVVYVAAQEKPCDPAGEAFEPLPVEAVLGNPGVVLRRESDPGFVKPAPLAADLFGEGLDAYLDLAGSPRRPGCRFERDAQRLQAAQPRVAYAHIVREQGFPGLALQYWFFFYFNDWTNRHEGDWEMIQLAFDVPSAKEALAKEPVRVVYAQHNGSEMAPWDGKKARREGSRPVVFFSAGSHASHFQPGIYIGRGENWSGFGCDDASRSTRRLSTEVMLVPNEPSGPDDRFAWLGFRGHWGEMAGRQFEGPTGPNRKWQWWAPLSWDAERSRQSSIRAPAPNALGPSAVRLFCHGVGAASELLFPVLFERPVASRVGLLALCLGAVGSLTLTRYLPARTKPLRCRRRLGQVLVAAFDIYRRHALVFASIGLAALPVTVLASASNWHLTDVAPGRLLDVPGGALVQRAALLFALAELKLGVIYALVAAASTTALARLEDGKPLSLGSAFSEVWRRLPDLLPGRLLAIAFVSALSFTVVGIPLALRQAVRWAFIEQAVLLDGKSWREAMAQSSTLVRGSWLWSAAAVSALGSLALAVAPGVGVVLILTLKSTPLAYVNLISALVYACLVPYIALGLALVYFDLKSRID